MWGCLTVERLEKSRRVIDSFMRGWRDGGRIVIGEPPAGDEPFVVYGQRWLAEQVIPSALKAGRPFWQIDNGFWLPARGSFSGYYRVSYRGLAPVLLEDVDRRRALAMQPRFHPWRDVGDHILFAHPGTYYGRCVGLDMPKWIDLTRKRLAARTRRPIVEREKYCDRPLADDLNNCWGVVTHSSNVAIDAVIAGIPVFVAETSPAFPVGNTTLDRLERPKMPDREAWWSSLMCQQFTLDEMRDGTAYRLLNRVRRQVDASLLLPGEI